jgi:hypothetical protein
MIVWTSYLFPACIAFVPPARRSREEVVVVGERGLTIVFISSVKFTPLEIKNRPSARTCKRGKWPALVAEATSSMRHAASIE